MRGKTLKSSKKIVVPDKGPLNVEFYFMRVEMILLIKLCICIFLL